MQHYNEPMTRGNKLLIVIALAVLMLITVIIYLTRGGGAPGPAAVTATPEVLPSIGDVIGNSQPATDIPVVEDTPEPTAEPIQELTATPVLQMTPAPTAITTLRKGDLGDGVKQMQLKLIQLGYLKGTADGEFGSGTLAAVKEFQRKNNLKADGVAGSATLTALYGPNPVPK